LALGAGVTPVGAGISAFLVSGADVQSRFAGS
jgi:hypothetical protein